MKQGNTQPAWFTKTNMYFTKIVKAFSWISAAALFVVALIATINVISDKAFSHPLSNVTELITYLNIPVVFFCIGFVQLDRGHTHIDLIYRRFKKPVHTVIHIAGDIVGLVVCGFAGWRGIVLTIDKYTSNTYATGPSSFKIWPFVVCIGIGYLLLALCYLWSIFREFTGRSPYEIDEGGGMESVEEGGGETV